MNKTVITYLDNVCCEYTKENGLNFNFIDMNNDSIMLWKTQNDNKILRFTEIANYHLNSNNEDDKIYLSELLLS